jgi:hypothetical protein
MPKATQLPVRLNLGAVLPEPLRTDITALVAEAETLEVQMHDFAVRCARVVTEFAETALEADDAQGFGDEGMRFVEKHSGVSYLLDLVEAMIDHLDVARLEPLGDVTSSEPADDES